MAEPNYLEHYGVLGMKWGVRKDKVKAFNKAGKKLKHLTDNVTKADRRYNKDRSTANYLRAKRTAAKRDKWYEKMQKVFSKIKFSDLEKSKLNLEYVAIGHDFALLDSLWKGTTDVKYLIPDLKDVR